MAVGAAAVGTLRLILASAVLLVHAGSLFRFNITGGGQVPVELFYIISGFYMALVLNEKYTGPGSARAFYLNRLLRLLPAYWVMAVLALAIYLTIYAVTGGGFFAWMAEPLSQAEPWRAAWFYCIEFHSGRDRLAWPLAAGAGPEYAHSCRAGMDAGG